MNHKESFKSELRNMEPYWAAVKDSLVNFHAYSAQRAESDVSKYIEDISAVMNDPNLVYHEEPFYLANDIALDEIPLAAHRPAYNTILRKRGLTVFEVA